MQPSAPNSSLAELDLAVNDLGPLAWVLDELRKSLDSAAKALKRFVRDAEAGRGSDLAAIDASQLRIARQQLHQAVGALEMVGLSGPALVLRAMEMAVQRFLQQPEQCTPEAAGKIESASFALTEYLEAVLAGRPISPVSLFPQYRDVQDLIKADRIHPADLWPFEWRWIDADMPVQADAKPYGDDARAVMDRSVLPLMKGNAPQAAVDLRDLSLSLAAGESASHPRIFWKIAAGYFEAVAQAVLPGDLYVRRATSRILLQYNALAKGDGSVSDRLAQDLLFFCAQAVAARASDAPVLSAVRAAYGLSRFKPVDYELVQFGRFDPALLAQARKRITSAKETWSSLSAGEVSKFKTVTDQFSLVADSLVKLHPPSEPLAQALTRAIDTTVRSGQQPGIELAMEVATSVLYLEAAFDDLDPTDPQLVVRTTNLADRLEGVRAGGAPQPLEGWMEELYRRVSDKHTMGSVVDELRVSLGELEKSLDAFFRNPADKGMLSSVPGQLSQMRGVLSVLGLDQASQAVLRMRESVEAMLVTDVDEQQARAAGTFDHLGNNLGALSFLIDMLNYQPALAKKLFVYDDVKGELQPLMGRVSSAENAVSALTINNVADALPATEVAEAPAAPAPNAVAEAAPLLLPETFGQADAATPEHELTQRLDAIASQAALADQPALARTAREAAAAVQSHDTAAANAAMSNLASAMAPVAAAPAPVDDGADFEEDDLRDIFLEEAREVVGTGKQALMALQRTPDDIGELTVLRRAFHTLKGSSRMVGLNTFGEAGWAMEQMLNSWLAEQKPASDELLALCRDAMDGFQRWVDDIAAGRDEQWTAKPFVTAAETMRGDGSYTPKVFQADAAAAAPVAADTVADPVAALPLEVPPAPIRAELTQAEVEPTAEAPVFELADAGEAVAGDFDLPRAAADQPLSRAAADQPLQAGTSTPAPVPAADELSTSDFDFDFNFGDSAAAGPTPAVQAAEAAAVSAAFESLHDLTLDLDGPPAVAEVGPVTAPVADKAAREAEALPNEATEAADGLRSTPAVAAALSNLSGAASSLAEGIDTSALSADTAASPDAALAGAVVNESADLADFDFLFDDSPPPAASVESTSDAGSMSDMAIEGIDFDSLAALSAFSAEAPEAAEPAAAEVEVIDFDSVEPPASLHPVDATVPGEDLPNAEFDSHFQGLDTPVATAPADAAGFESFADDTPPAAAVAESPELIGEPADGEPLIARDAREDADALATPPDVEAQDDTAVAFESLDAPHAPVSATAATATETDSAVEALAAAAPASPVAATATVDSVDMADVANMADDAVELTAQAGAPVPADSVDEQIRLIGDLRIGIPLYNVYLNEADEWSRRLVTEVSEWAFEGRQSVSESTVALAHSLAGSSATVGFEALSEIARALEHALQQSQGHHNSSVHQYGQLFVDAAEDIRRLLHQFAAGFLKEPDPSLLARLRELEYNDSALSMNSELGDSSLFVGDLSIDAPEGHEPDTRIWLDSPPASAPSADDIDMLAAEPLAMPTAAPTSPVRLVWPAPTQHHAPTVQAPVSFHVDEDDEIDAVDAIDPDLFAIFEEEGAELMPQLGSALRQWSARPDNLGARLEVLRVLHTLKGSARLAGALRLGEMAHRIETEIEHVGSDAAATQEFDPLLVRYDAMQVAFESLRHPDEAAAEAAEQAAMMVSHEAPVGQPEAVDASAATDGADVLPPSAAASTNVSVLPLTPADTPAQTGRQIVIPAPQAMAMQPLRQAANASVRVRSQLLDRMVNQAGEVMITRSRLEAELANLRGSLNDMSGNLNRLRQQLRDIELQAETQMQSRLAQAKELQAGFDPLEFDRFTRVQELTRMMAESVNDVATVQRTLQRTVEATEDDLIAQARQTRELQRDLLRTRMVEFEGISERLYRVVRQASKETGKQVRLDLLGGTIEMDRGMLDRMTPAFEHLLRNCVAHGIETPEVRTAAGKDPIGLITVHLRHEGNDVSVDFSDDGAGLDLQRIRDKAQSLGLLQPGQLIDDKDAANLIFMPGFSTAAQVTELAGRGIGMDVVRTEINAVGGRIETATVAGQGTHFKLVLPLTTAVTQVVMIRAAGLTIGVPANVVETVRRATAKELQQAYNSGTLDAGGEAIPFFWSGALLQASNHSSESQGKTTPIVVFRSAAQRIALHVDEVLGNQEVVVKNLGPQLSRLPGLAGMSVLASGAVVLIYNPVALSSVYGEQARALSADRAEPHMLEGAAAAADAAPGDARPTVVALPVAPAIPLVLVVDDSITVRRVTQRLLQREGYRVTLAADGLQALERLQDEVPTVVLSDIEMPRMDGFDLARNIRADSRLAKLPIIMITSRIAEKHREHARELGVDHYLGKPYSEEELMSLVRHYCNEAAASPV